MKFNKMFFFCCNINCWSSHTSIKMNKAAKNSSVDHSTLAKIAAISSFSDSKRRRRAPKSAVQPIPKRTNFSGDT